MAKRGHKVKKRVVKVGLNGIHNILREVEKAGHGSALAKKLGRNHGIVSMSASAYTQLRDLVMTEPALGDLRAQFGCDPVNDPECIPWG